jgi:orotate phosphoribosyltransferase
VLLRLEFEMAELSPAEETRAILSSCHAILENDHFVYCSGDHGSGWIDKDAVFPHTQHLERLGDLLAEAVQHLQPEVVCGPATGGLTVAQWTAHGLNAFCCFAEHGKADAKTGLPGKFGLHRGYDRLVAGRRVLVVDDVVDTGQSIRQTLSAVVEAGANIVGAAAFVNRGNVDARGIGVEHFIYLLEERIPCWPAADCKLCRDGVRVNTEHAHGQEFVDAQLRA